MKIFYTKFRIGLMTFAFGLASVYFMQNVKPAKSDDLTNAAIVTIAPKEPRFTETFRGCGLGYIQGFSTNDGLSLTAGTSGCEKPNPKDKRIVSRDNKRMISKIERENKMSYEIYRIEESDCINSPSIEVGLELEEYLNKNR